MSLRDRRLTRPQFLTLAATPVLAATVSSTSAQTPSAATPAATPVVTSSAPTTDEILADYLAAVEALRTRGRAVSASLLDGDAASVVAQAAPEVQAVVSSDEIAQAVTGIQANQVWFALDVVGAAWFGTFAPTAIDGYFQQTGALDTFTLVPDDAQTGDVPSGRWAGTLATFGLEFSVTFTGGAEDLSATLDIPAQGLAAYPLDRVAFHADAPIGERITERVLPMGSQHAYTDVRAWATSATRIDVSFDADDVIAGLQIAPNVTLPDDPAAGYVSTVTYQLPFTGAWCVIWGGDTELQNYHAPTPQQRHASDIVIWKDGATFAGDPAVNASYHVWGQPILAPAAGEVVAAVNDQPDQTPGLSLSQTNPEAFADLEIAGNHVVLQTAEGEFVFLAHLQEGSVRVQVGDVVQTGDVLGLVGNSGNTSEPHLHIHAQTSADLTDPMAIGLPLRFATYLANGETVTDGVPLQGEIIERVG